MDSKKARICELEFLELCTRIFAYKNNPTDIVKFFTFLRQFIDFDPRIISDLAREIFDLKYVPSKEEKVQLLHEKGYSLIEIGNLFKKSKASVCLWLKKETILFPRSTQEQQREVIKFMEQYNKLFSADMRNIL